MAVDLNLLQQTLAPYQVGTTGDVGTTTFNPQAYKPFYPYYGADRDSSTYARRNEVSGYVPLSYDSGQRQLFEAAPVPPDFLSNSQYQMLSDLSKLGMLPSKINTTPTLNSQKILDTLTGQGINLAGTKPASTTVPAGYMPPTDYYAQKVAQLNALSPEEQAAVKTQFGVTGAWTPAMVQSAFTQSNLTPEQHWLQYGKAEGLPAPSYTTDPVVDIPNVTPEWAAMQSQLMSDILPGMLQPQTQTQTTTPTMSPEWQALSGQMQSDILPRLLGEEQWGKYRTAAQKGIGMEASRQGTELIQNVLNQMASRNVLSSSITSDAMRKAYSDLSEYVTKGLTSVEADIIAKQLAATEVGGNLINQMMSQLKPATVTTTTEPPQTAQAGQLLAQLMGQLPKSLEEYQFVAQNPELFYPEVAPDYYTAKTQQLNTLSPEEQAAGKAAFGVTGVWTPEKVQQAFTQAGLTPEQHWNLYGRDEGLGRPSSYGA